MLITLVKVRTLYFPYREEDYEGLKAVGIPVASLGEDTLDLLKGLLRSKDHELKVLSFRDLEERMLLKVQTLWDFDFEQQGPDLVFSYPLFSFRRKDEKNRQKAHTQSQKLENAIKKWYFQFGIRLEKTTKQTKKVNRIVYTRHLPTKAK